MQAIIIKKTPVKEHDELVVCYSKEGGKKTYIAKSVFRHTSRQASHLDLFNLIDFSAVKGNGHPIIASAVCLNAFQNLKSNLQALSVAHFISDVFDKAVLAEQTDEKLWNYLSNWLVKLDELAISKHIVWPVVMKSVQQEIAQTMGYGLEMPPEALADKRLFSLQFAKKVIKS